MHPPRWFFVLFIVLGINVAVVLSTSLWHLAVADDKTLAEDGLVDDPIALDFAPALQAVQQNGVEGQNPAAENEQPNRDPESDEGASDLRGTETAELELPSTFPEMPPLGDLDAMENNPLFQEFKNIFSGNQGGQPLEVFGVDSSSQSDAYYVTLDQRLLTVARLTASSRSIAKEAAKLSRDGESSKATRLLKMSAQLREIAASLLVFEL